MAVLQRARWVPVKCGVVMPAGSGSTLVAALVEGVTGIEREERCMESRKWTIKPKSRPSEAISTTFRTRTTFEQSWIDLGRTVRSP